MTAPRRAVQVESPETRRSSSSPSPEIVAARDGTSFRPLYVQVRGLLLAQLASGALKPGELIPSETQLAAEYKVSQGTVRKALLSLEAERLLVRRQGRGTFVAQHTRQQALFHFFRMVTPAGERVTPTSLVLACGAGRAGPDEAAALGLPPGAGVHVIDRVRALDGRPAIRERVTVPAALLPGFAVTIGDEMREELYVLYQAQGLTIVRASERLAAVAAGAEDRRLLGVQAGTPMLEITRIAIDLNGRAVELRVSRCDTSRHRYAAEVF